MMPQATEQWVQIVLTILESGYTFLTVAASAAFAVIREVMAAPVSAAVAAESFKKERLATLGFKVILLLFVPGEA
jgi:hypothetical protein